MFDLGKFIKAGLMNAVGHMATYQIILNAAGWLDKGVLTEADLAEIHAVIEEYNALPEISTGANEETEEPEEEVTEEIPAT